MGLKKSINTGNMTLESTRTKYYFGILTNLMATIIIVGIGYITKVIETKKFVMVLILKEDEELFLRFIFQHFLGIRNWFTRHNLF